MEYLLSRLQRRLNTATPAKASPPLARSFSIRFSLIGTPSAVVSRHRRRADVAADDAGLLERIGTVGVVRQPDPTEPADARRAGPHSATPRSKPARSRESPQTTPTSGRADRNALVRRGSGPFRAGRRGPGSPLGSVAEVGSGRAQVGWGPRPPGRGCAGGLPRGALWRRAPSVA